MSKEGWFVISPGGRALAGPFKTKSEGKNEANSRATDDDIKVTVKYGIEDGWKFTAKPEPVAEIWADQVADTEDDDGGDSREPILRWAVQVKRADGKVVEKTFK